MGTTTKNLGLYKPAADEKGWGALVDTSFDIIDANLSSVLQTQALATGPAGQSAYQIAVSNGFTGTQAQWVASLQGAPGSIGIETAALDITHYNNLNPSKLASSSTLNQGLVFYGDGSSFAFQDLGFSGGYTLRSVVSSNFRHVRQFAPQGTPNSQNFITLGGDDLSATQYKLFADPSGNNPVLSVDKATSALTLNGTATLQNVIIPGKLSTSYYGTTNGTSGNSFNGTMALYADTDHFFGTTFYLDPNLSFTLASVVPDDRSFSFGFHHTGTAPTAPTDVYLLGFVLSSSQANFYQNRQTGKAAVSISNAGVMTSAGVVSPFVNAAATPDPNTITGRLTAFSDGGNEFGMTLFGDPRGVFSTLLYAPSSGSVTLGLYESSNAPSRRSDINTVALSAAKTGISLFPSSTNLNGTASVDPLGNISSLSLTASLVNGQVLSSNALQANGVTTLAEVAISKAQQESSCFSIPYTSATTLQAFGDSITVGAEAVPYANGYITLAAAALGVTLNNLAHSGDECADTSLRAIGGVNLGSNSKAICSVAIGTNDHNNKGVGAHEAVFNLCHQAILAWLTTRKEYRVDGDAATASNWSSDSSVFSSVTSAPAVTCATSNTQGANISYNITTYGRPLYVWYIIRDAVPGSFNIAIDNGPAIAVSCAPSSPIATSNGGNKGVALLRLPISAGAHTVKITVTSATGYYVSVVSMGTMAPHTYYTSPALAVGCVPPIQGDQKAQGTAQYSLDVVANVALLKGDGADIRLIDNRTPAQGGALALYGGVGDLHWNNAGHAAVAPFYVAGLSLPPDKSVARDVPPSSSSPCTPGDVWPASDGNIYAAKSYGAITRIAGATF